jgi:hypothetical protein
VNRLTRWFNPDLTIPEPAPPVVVREPEGTVVIGYCHDGRVEEEFAASLLGSYAYDRTLDKPILHPSPIRVAGSGRLYIQRDQMVREFLAGDGDWLLSIDTDHHWGVDAPHALLAAADPDSRPIIGALCFGTGRVPGALFPTTYLWQDGRLQCTTDLPAGGLIEVDGTGWAYLLVHRSVLEEMFHQYDSALPWFADGLLANGSILEGDLTFCLRARGSGHRIFVHCDVEAPHKKVQYLSRQFFDQIRARQEA